MNLKDELEIEILRSAKTAIQRSRNVQIVLLVACVLAWISYWNSKDNSWTRLRIKHESALVRIKGIAEQAMSNDSMLDYRNQRLKALQADTLVKYSAPELGRILTKKFGTGPVANQHFREVSLPVIDASFIAYVNSRGLAMPNEVRAMYEAIGKDSLTLAVLERSPESLDKLRKAVIDSVMLVKLPVIGLAFDVNDLALLAGLGFILIMLAWGFILIREGSSVAVVQDLIERLEYSSEHPMKLLAYQLVSMTNVLTVSPHLDINSSRSVVLFETADRWRNYVLFVITKALHFVPLVIFVRILQNDMETQRAGNVISEARTDIHMELSWWLFGILIAVTLFTFALNLMIELKWKQMAQDIHRQMQRH